MPSFEPRHWLEAIAASHNSHDVLAVVQDCLDHVPPAAREALPARVQTLQLMDAEQVSECAYELKRACMGPATDHLPTLDALSIVFTDAARRLTFLTGAHRRPAQFSPARLRGE